MENAHNSKWEHDRAARERHNAQRAHRRAERNRERASGTDWEDARTFLFRQWAAEDAATEEMLRRREKGVEEPDLSEEEIALADAVLDDLAKKWRAEDDAAAVARAATVAPEEGEPVYGTFIIPQYIELTDEEDEALTQAALEWGRKREERDARQQAQLRREEGDC